MVLDPSCDEALLLLNEIINFTVFTVQYFFPLSSSCMLCFVPGFLVLNKICFGKKSCISYEVLMVSFLLLCLINLILPVFIDKETINMALFCEHSSVIYNGE